jgi:hypothetical protein
MYALATPISNTYNTEEKENTEGINAAEHEL